MSLFSMSKYIGEAKSGGPEGGIESIRGRYAAAKAVDAQESVKNLTYRIRAIEFILADLYKKDVKEFSTFVDTIADRLRSEDIKSGAPAETIACPSCGRAVNIKLKACQICGSPIARGTA
jgi:hypothetical protein